MTHEFDGAKYKQASTHQKEWGARLIAELTFQGDEHVLDLGCGDGALTKVIADLVPRGEVIGIDASHGMIETALGGKKQDNLQFFFMDIDQLNYVDRFDVIFSNAALHWVKDHGRLLANAYRALRDNGQVRFNFAADGNCSHFFKVVREVLTLDVFRDRFAAFQWPWYMPTLDEYQAVVVASPFSSVRIWEENADRYFPDQESMIRWIDQPSLVPFLPLLPKQTQGKFRDIVIRKMIEETQQQDGRCFETFRRMNLTARKEVAG